MATVSAAASGTFRIGGDLEVTRLGYGAMRLTGPGIWGPPDDWATCVEVVRRLPALGVDFIDTAHSYGPYVSEEIIHEALHPYPGVTVATKAGLTRVGPNRWPPVGRPEYLRQEALMSARRLGLDVIPLFQLHRIDQAVPREEQFGLLRDLRDEGLVQHVGLSEVSVEEIRAARETVPIATVQNRYNLIDRAAEDVLQYCQQEDIGFIPWFPLAAGELARPGGIVDEIAQVHDATAGQVALAWLLAHSPVMLPIPGTSSLEHLEENVAAADLRLTDDEQARLDRAAG
jgi:aryl-alcohol dehydrogenase-like predicted oxidoreductase